MCLFDSLMTHGLLTGLHRRLVFFVCVCVCVCVGGGGCVFYVGFCCAFWEVVCVFVGGYVCVCMGGGGLFGRCRIL